MRAAHAVTIPTVMFYKVKADAESDTNGFTDTTKFADAHFVRVAVATRQAVYALTPVVAAFRSGAIGAEAVAGLGHGDLQGPAGNDVQPQRARREHRPELQL